MRKQRAGVVVVAVLAIVGGLVWRSCGRSEPADGTGPQAGATPIGSDRSRATVRDPNAPVTAALSGRVTRKDDGAGIANAIVSVAPAELMAMFVRSSAPTELAVTDANGNWVVPRARPGAYVVAATAAGFLPKAREKITVAAGEQRAGLDLMLAAGGTVVRGTVTDVGGGPIGAARITAHLDQRRELLGAAADFVASTGTDGKYEITLPPGRIQLEATHDDYTSEHRRTEVGTEPMTVDFSLVPGATIRGQVVARDTGKGVPGAIVRAEQAGSRGGGGGGGATTFCDEEGNFVMRSLDSGALELKALGRGYASTTPTAVAINIGEAVEGVRVLVERAYSISGKTVRKGTNAPLAGMTLGGFAMMTQQFGLALEPSGTDGAFEIVGLRPASYMLFAVGENSVPDIGKNVEVIDKDVTGVVVELDAGATLSGRVEPPIGGVELSLSFDGEIGLFNMFDAAKSMLVHGETDETGAFTLKNAPAGTLKITATAKDGQAGSLPVVVTAADQSGLVVKLEARASLAGRVIDTSGNPASGIPVYATPLEPKKDDVKVSFSMRGGREGATTNADGSFKLIGLTAGKYLVKAAFDPSEMRGARRDKTVAVSSKSEAEVELVVGAQRTGVVLTVEARDGVISGVVIGPDRKPAIDAWVRARWAPSREKGDDDRVMRSSGRFGGGGTSGPVLTNGEGRFTIEKLRRGTYDLLVDGPRGASHGEKPGIDSGDRNVTIELASFGSLTGVVTLGGAPVGKYTIDCNDTVRQVEAKDGAYSIEHLKPAAYKCSVESDGGSAEAKVDVPAGAAKLDIALTRWASVTGTVVGVLDKKPIVGVTVFSGGEYSSRNMTAVLTGGAPKTDVAGKFVIDHVAVGKGRVAVMPKRGFTPLGGKDYVANEGARVDIGVVEIVPPHDGDDGTFGMSTKLEGDKLIVDSVTDGGVAAAAGVASGDRITAINGFEVGKALPAGIAAFLLTKGNVGVGFSAALTLDRNGAPVSVTLVSVKS